MVYYDVKILYKSGNYEIIKNCTDIICRDDYISLYEKINIHNEYRRHYIIMDNSIISTVITKSESGVH